MDASVNEFFKGSQHGFTFLQLDFLTSNLGIAEAPLRFFIGILLGLHLMLFILFFIMF